MTGDTTEPRSAADHQRLSISIREETGLRWRRSQECLLEQRLTTSDAQYEPEDKGPPRPSVLRALASRNKITILVFSCCAIILIHGILTAINQPPPGKLCLAIVPTEQALVATFWEPSCTHGGK